MATAASAQVMTGTLDLVVHYQRIILLPSMAFHLYSISDTIEEVIDTINSAGIGASAYLNGGALHPKPIQLEASRY